MDGKAKHGKLCQRLSRQRGEYDGGCNAAPAAACPGDDRAARKDAAAGRMPDLHMIFGNGKTLRGQRLQRARAIKPRRRDKARNRPPDDILQQGPAVAHAPRGLFAVKAKKFTFSGGHMARLQSGEMAAMVRQVAVKPAMEKYFRSAFGPAPKAGGEG